MVRFCDFSKTSHLYAGLLLCTPGRHGTIRRNEITIIQLLPWLPEIDISMDHRTRGARVQDISIYLGGWECGDTRYTYSGYLKRGKQFAPKTECALFASSQTLDIGFCLYVECSNVSLLCPKRPGYIYFSAPDDDAVRHWSTNWWEIWKMRGRDGKHR